MPEETPEFKTAYSQPAMHCNRFFVSVDEGIVRLAFLEGNGKGEHTFLSAVTMSPANVAALHEFLGTIIQKK